MFYNLHCSCLNLMCAVLLSDIVIFCAWERSQLLRDSKLKMFRILFWYLFYLRIYFKKFTIWTLYFNQKHLSTPDNSTAYNLWNEKRVKIYIFYNYLYYSRGHIGDLSWYVLKTLQEAGSTNSHSVLSTFYWKVSSTYALK